MPSSTLLLLLAPFLALALVLGLVMIVAVCRARPEDVPSLMTTFAAAFGRLVDRLPRRPVPPANLHDEPVELDPGGRMGGAHGGLHGEEAGP